MALASALVLSGIVGVAVSDRVSTAAAASQTKLELSGVPTAVFGQRVALHVSWSHAGQPVTGRVNLQRKDGSRWVHMKQFAVKDGKGTSVIWPGGSNHYRLRPSPSSSVSPSGVTTKHPGGTSNIYSVKLQRWKLRAASPELTGPAVVDSGESATLKIDWEANTWPVNGHVNLQRLGSNGWVHKRKVRVTNGTATTVVRPTSTTTYRLRATDASKPSGVWTGDPHGTSNRFTVIAVPDRAAVPGTFTVKGAGWGHGVGMSQYGAYAMAADGYDATDILNHYYTGTRVTTATSNPDVRVQVRNSSSPVDVRVSGGRAQIKVGGRVVHRVDNKDSIRVRPISAGVRVSADGKSWDTASTRNRVMIEWAGTRWYQSGNSVPVNVSVSGAHNYRHGRLEVKGIDGRVNLVNVVELADEYMYGIAEVPSSWPAEALKAQAIAARSYALGGMPSSPRSSCDCHMYNDTRSQVFTGWDKENQTTWGKRWKAAVDATVASNGRGQIVARTGSSSPITAYYFSSSGGRTQHSEEVWSSKLSYTRSVADPWSLKSVNPNRSWTATVSQSAMAKAFGLSNITDVRVTSRTTGDGAKTVRATSQSGATKTLSGEVFRSRLGLKATWISSIK